MNAWRRAEPGSAPSSQCDRGPSSYRFGQIKRLLAALTHNVYFGVRRGESLIAHAADPGLAESARNFWSDAIFALLRRTWDLAR